MTVCSVLTIQFSQSHLTCIELYIFMANSIFCHMLIFKSIKCACDLLRSIILTKHIWIWTVTMRRLLYVILVWIGGFWTTDSQRRPVGRQLKSLRASPRPQKTRLPLPSCRVSPLINGSSANHRIQSVDLSLLLLSPLYTLNFAFASRPIRFKLLKTHSSTLSACRLQRLLSSGVGSQASPSNTQCFSFGSWRSEAFRTRPKALWPWLAAAWRSSSVEAKYSVWRLQCEANTWWEEAALD